MNESGLYRTQYSDRLVEAAEDYLVQLFQLNGAYDANIENQEVGISAALIIISGLTPVEHDVSVSREVVTYQEEEDE